MLSYIEKCMAIVMDNASFHRKKQLYEICKKYEVNLIFLPPYSPELNPIEKILVCIKAQNKSFFT